MYIYMHINIYLNKMYKYIKRRLCEESPVRFGRKQREREIMTHARIHRQERDRDRKTHTGLVGGRWRRGEGGGGADREGEGE